MIVGSGRGNLLIMGVERDRDAVVLSAADFGVLIDALKAEHYTVLGPTLRDQVVVYEEIDGVADLPRGWTDEQDGGTYRLHRRDDGAFFGFVVGPDSWKKTLHPPTLPLVSASRAGRTYRYEPVEDDPPRYAFLGVRACELNAIAIQDRVFLEGGYVDPHYQRRRESIFTVAVNCISTASTCFCVSMGTGPEVNRYYDLAMTELVGDGDHRFLFTAGSDAGRAVLDRLPTRPADDEDRRQARAVMDATAAAMGRTMNTDGIQELLYDNLDHPRWDDIADRCLACGNCTMVCPTCFCTTVEDVTDLDGKHAERHRVWDSCFNVEFSHIHGGSVRTSRHALYRQWMTHKLAGWIPQFGSSGCVGCGRCISWCPVGIDITEEIAAIRAAPQVSQPEAIP